MDMDLSEKLKTTGAAAGAVGLGGFAAALGLCCSVPWAVALFGVGGAVAFARLAFLVPYALLGAATFLAVGFWLAYRRPVCDDGTCVTASRGSLRVVVWTSTVVVVGLAVVAMSYRVTIS